ncbi:MAG: glycosyltransferase family 4 protein [Chloroflexota bacterium]
MGFLTYGLDRPLSGVTRVAWELGRRLNEREDCEVVYLAPYRRGPFADGNGYRAWYLPGCSRLPGLMALGGPLIALAARRLGLDVVHDPIGTNPFTVGRGLGPFKRVVTIHDAIAFRYPQGYPWLNNFLHRRYIPALLGQVDAVITVSRYSKRELTRFLRLPAAAVAVVPNGVDGRFRPLSAGSARAVAARYGLSGRYILSVGAVQARKNLGQLLEAFARLHALFPQHKLAIAGPSLWKHEGLQSQVSRLGLVDKVALLGYVADEDLPALYGAAEAFVFPSLYEGFGLPPLEAMACGCPVVCSDATSLPEVAGDAALLVNAGDPADLAEGMRRVLEDGDLRMQLRERGLLRAGAFSWEETARLTLDTYRRVAG